MAGLLDCVSEIDFANCFADAVYGLGIIVHSIRWTQNIVVHGLFARIDSIEIIG